MYIYIYCEGAARLWTGRCTLVERALHACGTGAARLWTGRKRYIYHFKGPFKDL